MGAAHSKRNLLETKDTLLSRFSHAPIPNSHSKAFNLALPWHGCKAAPSPTYPLLFSHAPILFVRVAPG